MKDHELRELVSDMVDLARVYHGCPCLQDVFNHRLREFCITNGWLPAQDREGGEMNWPDGVERV